MLDDLQTSIQKSLEHLQMQFRKLQAGRASASMVEEISVESYGSRMALKGVANISCPDAKTVRIEPWDKNLLSAVEKGIIASDLGLNPQNFGDHILLAIPPLTEERRKKLGKLVHEEVEHARISVRTARQEAMKKAKQQEAADEISEDERVRLEKKIQEKVDEANKKIDELAKKKETDILTV